MKIAFIYSEKYIKYEKLAQELINDLKAKDKRVKNSFDVNKKSSKKKYDLFIIFSDDKEDFDIAYSNTNGKTMLITNNLKSEYVSHIITKVSDVVYAKNNIDVVIRRVMHNVV